MKTGDLVELSSSAKRTGFWESLFGAKKHTMFGLVLSYDFYSNTRAVRWSNGRKQSRIGVKDLVKAY